MVAIIIGIIWLFEELAEACEAVAGEGEVLSHVWVATFAV